MWARLKPNKFPKEPNDLPSLLISRVFWLGPFLGTVFGRHDWCDITGTRDSSFQLFLPHDLFSSPKSTGCTTLCMKNPTLIFFCHSDPCSVLTRACRFLPSLSFSVSSKRITGETTGCICAFPSPPRWPSPTKGSTPRNCLQKIV